MPLKGGLSERVLLFCPFAEFAGTWGQPHTGSGMEPGSTRAAVDPGIADAVLVPGATGSCLEPGSVGADLEATSARADLGSGVMVIGLESGSIGAVLQLRSMVTSPALGSTEINLDLTLLE